MKEFIVKVSTMVSIPYEEGLLDGDVNKNHLMYVAVSKLKGKENILSYNQGTPIFQFTLRDENRDTLL